MVQIVQVVAFDTVIVFLLLILPSIIFVAGSSSFTSTEQVEALLNWKSTLVTQTASSFLPSWKRDFGAVSPCNWSGITCSNKGSVIVGLNLTGLGLQGTLLGFNFSCFANLVSLVLSNNKLFGFIPPQISNLISLIHLDLSQNELSGFIPEEIGSLSSLTTLALYTNKLNVNQVVAVFVFFFVGFFFEYIFVSGGSLFTSTHTQQDEQVEALLNWKSTLVSQTSSLLPSWKRENSTTTSVLNPCKWSGITCNDEESVVELNMTGLGLQGTLDGFNFSCFTNFVSLDLSSNKFSGFIPQQIGNISKLTHLDFSQNEFSGFIPEEIGRLSSLTTLALYTNKLNGSIPTSLYDLRNLTKLLLFGNRLT
ncbi:hypothetical protein C5167_000341, partial [Papaver somniferum]